MSEVNWAEKRNALRQRTLKEGRIVIAGMSTMDCMIRNMSLTGARLALPNATYLPDEFELLIGAEGLRRDCEVMSRTESSVGIRFTQPLTSRELGAEFMSAKRSAQTIEQSRSHHSPSPEGADKTQQAARAVVDAPPVDADPERVPKLAPHPLPTVIRQHLPWKVDG